jgi:translation initiation factor 4A
VIEQLGEFMQLKIHVSIGGTQIRDEIKKLKEGPHIVVGTPGRINDMLKKGFLKSEFIKLLVLDEADEMLSRGFKE